MLLAIALMGVASRTPMAPVGVLQELIREGTGLSHGSLGLLTTIPVVVFALSSLAVSRVRSRFGLARTMAAGLAATAAGVLVRSWCGNWGIFAGTALVGLGLSASNVLIPSAVKENFPARAGAVTGLYTSCMYIASAAAAATALPVAAASGSWRLALSLWFPAVLAAFFAWLFLARKAGGAAGRDAGSGGAVTALLRRSETWWITLLMGSQSVLYYSVMAWLPAILQSHGFSGAMAGEFTSVFQLSGAAGAVLSGIFLNRVKDLRGLCALLGGLFAAAVALLALGTGAGVLLLCAVLLGLCCSSSFSVVYCVVALRSADAQSAARLSGLSQTFGYLLAAACPTLMGKLFELTGSWLAPLCVLALAGVLYGTAGVMVGKCKEME